jgi:hypothetical protein
MTPAVSATGLKGFLQWLQADQPAVYAAAAKQIAKAVPKGFSGFNGSALMSRRLAAGRRSMALRGYAGLGDCGSCGISAIGTCATLATSSINFGCNVETSCAANSGATCAPSLTGIANIINSVAGAALTAQQNAAYNQLIQTQLSRASTGLSPLQLSSSAAGIPTIAGLTSGSTGTLLLIGGAGVVLYLLFGRS